MAGEPNGREELLRLLGFLSALTAGYPEFAPGQTRHSFDLPEGHVRWLWRPGVSAASRITNDLTLIDDLRSRIPLNSYEVKAWFKPVTSIERYTGIPELHVLGVSPIGSVKFDDSKLIAKAEALTRKG